jgi:hypothetical protein
MNMSHTQTFAINEVKIQAKKQLKQSKQEGSLSENKPLKHYLQLISITLGFESWQQANAVLSGTSTSKYENDFGTLFHHRSCNALVNEWFADYQTAYTRYCRSDEHYLLPYKKQFVVAGKEYLFAIGLREEDLVLVEDIHRNWITGYGTHAWDRLASIVIRRRFEYAQAS